MSGLLHLMPDKSEKLIKIAVVSTNTGISFPIMAYRRPSPRELTLLYALCEHVSKTISMNDLCYRLKTSENSVRIAATRLRKKLSDDWAIKGDSGRKSDNRRGGLRILYIGSPLAEADRTYVELV
jgi:uncharacterized membrane protein